LISTDSFWSTLSWAVGDEGDGAESENSTVERSDASLSNLSLLLLVALCCHSAKATTTENANEDDDFDEDRTAETKEEPNRYRAAVATFGNEQG